MAYVVETEKAWRCRDYKGLAHPVIGLYDPGTIRELYTIQGQVDQVLEYTAGALIGTPDGYYGQVAQSLWAWLYYNYAFDPLVFYVVKATGQVLSYVVTPPYRATYGLEVLNITVPVDDRVPLMYMGVELKTKPDAGQATKLSFGGLLAKSGTLISSPNLAEVVLTGDEEIVIAAYAHEIIAADEALLSMLNKGQYESGDVIRVYQSIVPEHLGLPALVISPIDSRDTPLLNQERLMVRGMIDMKVVSSDNYQQAADIYNRADAVLTGKITTQNSVDYSLGRFHRVKSFRYPEPVGKTYRYHVGGTYRCFAQQI